MVLRRTLSVALAVFFTPTVRGRVVNHLSFFTLADPLALPTQYFDMPIDHFNGTPGTYQNRYWINDTYYQPGGPVVLYDSGEEDAAPDISLLLEADGTQSAVMQTAAKYHGIGVVWEHRYYGQSLPFVTGNSSHPVQDYTADQWQFLTVDQALQDVVVFANSFTLPAGSPAANRLLSKDALQASKTPWIFIGGSYPGVRAAMLRVRNPETIFASWASSAPVQAQVNMASYMEAVQRGLPKNCSADYAVAVKFAEDALNGDNTTLANEVKLLLAKAATPLGSGNVTQADADGYSAFDLAEILQRPFFLFQYTGPGGMRAPCDAFESAGGSTSASDVGLAPTLGPEGTFRAAVTKMIIPAQYTPWNASAQGSYDWISWQYQYCTQFGFFQVADPNNTASIEPQADSIVAEQNVCNVQFPNMLPPSPRVDDVLKYGGWKMSPARTFFSNGELDPWRTLSVGSVESNSPFRNASTTVPDFNAAPPDETYYGVIYPGQVHGSDLSGGPFNTNGSNAAFQNSLMMFTKALDAWLPQFTASNGSAPSSSTGGATSSTPATTGKPSGSVPRFAGFPYLSVGVTAVLAVLM